MRTGRLGKLADALRHTSLSYFVYRYRYLATFTLIGFLSIVVEVQLARYVLPAAWPWQAKMLVAFLLGLALSCTLNVTLNFQVPRGHLLATFRRFALVSCVSFALNMLIVAVSQEYLGQAYGAARLVSAAFLFVLAYSVHRRFTFDLARNFGVAVYAAESEDVERIHRLIGRNCDHLHVDLVDASMCPTAAPVDLGKLRRVRELWPDLPVGLHVMSLYPRRWAEQTWDQIDWLLFHVNCKDDVGDLIGQCRVRGKKVGVVWHTSSTLGQLVPWLPHVDFVMVLGIANPGQSGQALLEDAVAVTAMLDRLRPRYGFEVMFDGGVSRATVGRIAAKYVVSASAVLRSADPVRSAHVLRTGGKYERVAEQQILDGVWRVAERHDFVVSATVTGSFVERPSLEGISDIDLVVVVDHLNRERFDTLQKQFDDTLRPLLTRHGYGLRINPTLGPLKFNDPRLAVLHLMVYSEPAHVEHVLKSPFTCLDWQRSHAYRKRSLADVFPVFGLQPRHFVGGRRGMADYLKDFDARAVSYRELVCSAEGYSERARQLPMNERDRHEFAYHVIRFLMSNLLKLLTRTNAVFAGDELLRQYFAVFPEGRAEVGAAYLELKRMKDRHDFTEPLPQLDAVLRGFLASFERQFRALFVETATRHVVVRHAPTPLNQGEGDDVRFVGRLDPDLMALPSFACEVVAAALGECDVRRVFVSPARRSWQTVERLRGEYPLPSPEADSRLHEQSYGELEGWTVRAARSAYPHLFAAWARGEDPPLPGGESVGDVHDRVQHFAHDRWTSDGDTLTCTHNVVLRCLIGATLGVPKADWHRLRVPHLTPFTFVRTRAHGLFIDIDPACERRLFASFHRSLAG